MSRPIASAASDQSAGVAAVFTCLVVVAVVATGWFRIFLNSLPPDIDFLAWVFAIFFGAWAIVLARAVAAEQIRATEDESRFASRVWLAGCLLLLFFLSAIGTVSTVLYYGEGDNVLAENIATAEKCIDRLVAAAPSLLATPSFKAKSDRVDSLRRAFEAEVRNPRNCGEGKVAHARFQELQRELPELRPLSGHSRNCADAEPIIAQYRQMIADHLRNTEEFRFDRVAEKEELRGSFTAFVRGSRSTLASAKESLGTSAFGIDRATARLETVTKGINSYTERARSLSVQPVEMQCPMQLEQVRGLGTFWQVVPLLLARADRISTHVYWLVAVGFDLLLVIMLTRALRSTSQSFSAVRRGSGPKYLWVNP